MSDLTLFHSPHTRSTGACFLLEELGAQEGRDYQLQVLDMNADEQREPAYLAINPMGKVPALRHGDALITEQPAVFIYLADLFAAAGLAPALHDPQRGPYLRWLVYYGSAFEPAVVDRFMKREPAPRSISPYGDYETMLQTLIDTLTRGPYLLGERFSAADVLWGTALSWITAFGLMAKTPLIEAYIERVTRRPACWRVHERDLMLAAAQAGGTAV